MLIAKFVVVIIKLRIVIFMEDCTTIPAEGKSEVPMIAYPLPSKITFERPDNEKHGCESESEVVRLPVSSVSTPERMLFPHRRLLSHGTALYVTSSKQRKQKDTVWGIL
jgi:hypothetical protein